jgi:hypothetical protein
MLPPIPYFDVPGYRRFSNHVDSAIDSVVTLYPGHIEHRIAAGSSRINSRLAKRYLVPLGQSAPALLAFGTSPPPISLSGRPTLGSLEMALQITTGGGLGAALFQWSSDGGITWTTGVATAALVPLGTTGLVASFAAATYGVDNIYKASTPVPAIALGWLTQIVDVDVWIKRGTNPQDATIVDWKALRQEALDEIREAADSKDGLFELPTLDTLGDSAANHGGPLFYSETSPFVGADFQESLGRQEDDAAYSATTQPAGPFGTGGGI